MDPSLREFLASGKSIITDTMAVKSEPVKIKKGTAMEKVEVRDWDKVLISRCKDEKVSKKDVVVEFKKIIDREEALI
jgi:hypothetical protein